MAVALNAVFKLVFVTGLQKPHIDCKHRPIHDFGGLIEIKMKMPTDAISCRANFRLPARRQARKLSSYLNRFTVIWPKALHIFQSEMVHECRIASVGT